MRKLVLFDIDGTLLRTEGAGRRAIHAALRDELGFAGPFNGVRFDGKTDPQIVEELLAAAGAPGPPGEHEVAAVCRRYLELLARELEAGRPDLVVLAGVRDLLDRLEREGDVLLGLLTGNLADGARLKLAAAGIAPERFRVGAFGSDAAVRSDLPPIAVNRATPVMGRTPHGDEVVIIGDTPADMSCGAALGVRAIGVTTGAYGADELRAAGGAGVFASLADERVYDAICS